MTLETYMKMQRKELKKFEKLTKSDPERARQDALERLNRAGILTAKGNLTSRYK